MKLKNLGQSIICLLILGCTALYSDQGKTPFKGYYRYGCWNSYKPAETWAEPNMIAGHAYRISGKKNE